jgi:DNA-binding SARP family transcriptional activator
MRFRVLGLLQVRVRNGPAWSTIRAGQQRQVLAVLLAEVGQIVSVDRLAYEIWGERPPRSAVSATRGYVMRLRRLLGAGRGYGLLTQGHGYQLVVDDAELDAGRFERLLAAGQHSMARGDSPAAVSLLSQALALWTGAAMADVPATPTVTAEAARLERRRLAARELWAAGQLDLGRHADVVDDLHQLVAQHPLHERLREQLMLALYRCGRRAEALECYRLGRELTVAELGLEPGPELQAMHAALLTNDLAVLGSPTSSPPHR